MNRIFENNYKSTKPEVGMGVTELCYSDRHAYTVIEVVNTRKIVVQRDKAIRTDSNGMSDMQSYEFERRPDGYRSILTLRKDGHWRRLGSGRYGNVYMIGGRDEYYDYSF